MSAQELSAAAGVLLSLLFSYVPKLKDWYEVQEPVVKRVTMLVALLVSAATVYGLACANSPIAAGVTCDGGGAWGLVTAFVSALAANQATYLISPRLDDGP